MTEPVEHLPPDADARGTHGPYTDADPSACPAGRRRRGPALEKAIHEAALGLLAEHGLGSLTIEGVANAARTGKASVYRRWPSKEDLVLDALDCTMINVDEVESSGSLRTDLLTSLSMMAAFVTGPNGQILRSLLGGAEPGHPLQEMLRTRLIEPRLQRVIRLIEQAIERGEARPGTAVLTFAQVGPAVLLHRFLLYGRVTSDDVTEIIDDVVLPLLRCGSASSTEGVPTDDDTTPAL